MSEENNQPEQFSVSDLYVLVRLLEDLSTLKRLSTSEMDNVRPAFQRAVDLIAQYEKSQAQQTIETEEEVLDLGEDSVTIEEVKAVKKAAKKKASPKKKTK